MRARRSGFASASDALGWVVLWLVVIAVALATRPLLPLIETRSLAVAWEMWRTGDFLVPHLNGEPYSHKPPLLFWLIHLGWWVLGVNEWWPRLVAPLTALGTVALTYRLGRRLWPERAEVAALAPWILAGGWLWLVMGTMTMYDVLVAFGAVLAIGGLWSATGGRALGWLWFGLGIGLGVLAKGPVILVFTLPALLLTPWWCAAPPPGGWRRWSLGALAGLIFGAGLAFAWALPAAEAGGEAYGAALLWGQTSGRLVSSFAHQRPFWWYVALSPLLLAPWLAWPSLWRGARGGHVPWRDPGFRLGLGWLIAGVAILSLVSGKQPHYMIAVLPAFALVVARRIAGRASTSRWPQILPGSIVVGLGIVLMAAILGPAMGIRAPAWMSDIPWYAPLLIAALGIAVMVVRARPAVIARALAVQAAAVVVVIHLFVMPAAAPLYDVRSAATLMHEWQQADIPLAFIKTYHGQFHFIGRLDRPIEEIDTDRAAEWVIAHPGGRIIALHKPGALPEPGVAPLYLGPFRGKLLAIWSAEAVRADPDMFR